MLTVNTFLIAYPHFINSFQQIIHEPWCNSVNHNTGNGFHCSWVYGWGSSYYCDTHTQKYTPHLHIQQQLFKNNCSYPENTHTYIQQINVFDISISISTLLGNLLLGVLLGDFSTFELWIITKPVYITLIYSRNQNVCMQHMNMKMNKNCSKF